jgi:hypothetical protein
VAPLPLVFDILDAHILPGISFQRGHISLRE